MAASAPELSANRSQRRIFPWGAALFALSNGNLNCGCPIALQHRRAEPWGVDV